MLLLIPIVWLGVAAFFVILCRAAAAGEEAPAPVAESGHPSPPLVIAGVALWEDAPAPAIRVAGRRHVARRRRSPHAHAGAVRSAR